MFDAAKARTQRPCPIWINALLLDTSSFDAEEFGGYVRILLLMWSNRDCALPDCDRRLAAAAGVSTHKWRRRLGPLIRPLLTPCGGNLVTQKRLLQEARKVERELTLQSNRRRRPPVAKFSPTNGPKPLKSHDEDASADDPRIDRDTECAGVFGRKSLKSHEPDPSADFSGAARASESEAETVAKFSPTNGPKSLKSANPDPSAEVPIYSNRNVPTSDDDDDDDLRERASAGLEGGEGLTLRRRILEAVGADPRTGLAGRGGHILGGPSDMETVRRWSADLGLTTDEQVGVIREVMQRKQDGPPSRLAYFDREMARLAGAKSSPRSQPRPAGGAALGSYPPRRVYMPKVPDDGD